MTGAALCPMKGSEAGPAGSVSMVSRIDIEAHITSTDQVTEYPLSIKLFMYPDGKMQIVQDVWRPGGIGPNEIMYAGIWFNPVTAGVGASYDDKFTLTAGTIQPPSDDLDVWLTMPVLTQLDSTQPAAPVPIDTIGHFQGRLADQFVFRVDVSNTGAATSLDNTIIHINVNYLINHAPGS